MKNLLQRTILAAMAMLFVIQLPSFAFDQYESMKVGETKTFYFPSEVTSKASSMYSYSCSSDYINNVEVVSYTNSSVTVKAIAYTKYTVNIRFDYWWRENGYSKTDTHKVHIDLSDSDGQVTPIGGDYNPNNYFWDKGSWGTVTIEAGETDYFYCQFKNSESDPNVKSIVWSSYGQIGYEILSQNSTSCIIKGNYECNGQKLWCLMKYGSTSYRAYYTINVKESSKEKLTLSAEPNGGTVENGRIVYLTASQPSSDIYYTTDGSTPTQSSKKYSYSGIPIYNNCTLKAVAYKSGYNNSSVMTWIFTVKESDENAIAINSTNFPDDNFRAYLLSQDYGKDGKLTESEIKGVTKIDVWWKDIESLKGIEYFKTLKYLDCANNKLTSLDVSKNTALTELYCYNNQLTSLDVSKNTALKDLYCDINQLSSLNVFKNTALTELSCGHNQLTSLDVSKNTALTILHCESNQLTSLDVSKNTALTILYCYNNQLTSLDVSKNTALTELLCSRNQLNSLDASKNTALTKLDCGNNQLNSLDVSKNTVLKSLDCRDNQLNSLDVSKNTVLNELYCANNRLTSLDVSKNTALTELYCYNNQLTSLDVSKNMALTMLSCGYNQLTSLDVSKNTALTGLSCYKNQLTSLDVSKNTALDYLWCYRNQIKGKAMDDLIGSMPITSSGVFDVYDSTGDGNVCTKSQVAKAKSKGWIAKHWDGMKYVDYEGSDEATAINDAKSQPDITDDAAVYSLSGQRLAAPRKGLNIIGGKKVVMK